MSSLVLYLYYCVMNNMSGHFQDGHYVAKIFTVVRDRLRELGYLVSKVMSLWSPGGDFLGFAVVEFGTTDAHRDSAFKLQCMFEMRGHGYSDWISKAGRGAEPYLWVATPKDRRRIRARPGTAHSRVPGTVRVNAELDATADIYNPYDSCVAALYSLTH